MRDAEEFDALYAACAGRVVGHVYALTGNRAEAEDAVAEAFMRAWQRWGRCGRRTARRPGSAGWPRGSR